MSSEPVVFAADYVERRSRVTTFFRLFLAIPHFIVLFFYGIAAFVAVVIAWFAIVFTARWPEALYNFVAGYQRWTARANSYLYLLADPYPPFDGGEHPEYPSRLHIGPPKPQYDRAKALFRIVLAIPVFIVAYVLNMVAELIGVLSWLVIVILGRQPEGLHQVLRFCLSYLQRAGAYILLLTEDWPSLGEPGDSAAPGVVSITPADQSPGFATGASPE